MAKKQQLPKQHELFRASDYLVVDPLVNDILPIANKHLDAAVSIVRYSILHPSTVFTHLHASKMQKTGEKYQKWKVFGVETMTTPKRLFSFENQLKCVCCGREGNAFLIENHVNDVKFQYLNLYSIGPADIVLMTVDHILPDSMGGRYDAANFQTMCRTCNQTKQNIMSAEEVALVRANPKLYCKSWVYIPFLHAMLDLQDMMRNATGDHAVKLNAVFDGWRRSVQFNTKEQEAAKKTAELRRVIDVVNGVAPVNTKPVRPSWIKRNIIGADLFLKEIRKIYKRVCADIAKAHRRSFAR